MHFIKVGKDTAECQIVGCNKILKVASGPSGLIKHLFTQHKLNDPKRKYEEDEFLDSSASTSQPSKRRKTIQECIDYYEDFNETIARLCVEESVPIKQVATGRYYARTLKMLFPKENIPKSEKDVKRRVRLCYEKILEKTKAKISNMKSWGKKFSLTLDEWTSNKNIRYLNVNCHFFDAGRKKFINLGLIRIKGSATSGRINELVSTRKCEETSELTSFVRFFIVVQAPSSEIWS